jgi:transposase
VHRFNALGSDGVTDIRGPGPNPRLMPEDKAKLAAIVEAGPDVAIDGVVRWRRIDLQKVIKERFNVDYDERYVGKLLKQLGFSHISARPRHPTQDAAIMAAFKKTSLPR